MPQKLVFRLKREIKMPQNSKIVSENREIKMQQNSHAAKISCLKIVSCFVSQLITFMILRNLLMSG